MTMNNLKVCYNHSIPDIRVCQAFYPSYWYKIYMSKFSERLRELRISRDLKQSELAESLSVDQRTISNWERGVNEPDYDVLIKLAKYFGETTDYLLGLVD